MGVVSRRVLVVDDYADTVTTMCEALNASGCTAVGVHTGRQAITMTRVFLPDVVLLDLGLPDIPGLDVARAIRQVNQRLVIIVITGWTQSTLRERAYANNDIDAFEIKPAELHELLPLIRYGRREV